MLKAKQTENIVPRYRNIDHSKGELLCRWALPILERITAITHTKTICFMASDLVAWLRYHQGLLIAKRRSQLIIAKLPRVEKKQRRPAKSSSGVFSFGHTFLKIKNFVLWTADNADQMTSVAARLHRRSNEGRWMVRMRKTATRMTALHVTDNKANKVSRGRTTKLVMSRKVCCACSGRLVKRHRRFGNLTAEAVWLKSKAPGCNKTIITVPVKFFDRRNRRNFLWQRVPQFWCAHVQARVSINCWMLIYDNENFAVKQVDEAHRQMITKLTFRTLAFRQRVIAIRSGRSTNSRNATSFLPWRWKFDPNQLLW